MIFGARRGLSCYPVRQSVDTKTAIRALFVFHLDPQPLLLKVAMCQIPLSTRPMKRRRVVVGEIYAAVAGLVLASSVIVGLTAPDNGREQVKRFDHFAAMKRSDHFS